MSAVWGAAVLVLQTTILILILRFQEWSPPRCATLAYETNAPKPFHRNSIGYLQSSQAHHAVFFGVMPDNQISAS